MCVRAHVCVFFSRVWMQHWTQTPYVLKWTASVGWDLRDHPEIQTMAYWGGPGGVAVLFRMALYLLPVSCTSAFICVCVCVPMRSQ